MSWIRWYTIGTVKWIIVAYLQHRAVRTDDQVSSLTRNGVQTRLQHRERGQQLETVLSIALLKNTKKTPVVELISAAIYSLRQEAAMLTMTTEKEEKDQLHNFLLGQQIRYLIMHVT